MPTPTLTRTPPVRRIFLVTLLSLLLFPAIAWAEPSDSDKEEAARRFQQGVELHDAGDFRGAQIEFRQAYRLAPVYHLLFNLGQESMELKEYVDAHTNFVQYLRDGGDEITPARRVFVEREISRVQKYLATLDLDISVEGAEVAIDGIVVGVSPLKSPAQVSVGRRKIVVSLEGYAPWERTMDVAGEERKTVKVQLISLRAIIAPTTPVVVSSSSRPTRFWASLGATGVLMVGTGIAAVLTRDAKSDYESEIGSIDTLDGKLQRIDDAGQKYKRLALYTDIGIGLTAVGLITTIVFSGKETERRTMSSTNLQMTISPNRVGFSGVF